ncbi:hypothetical protein GGS23DRAFT_614992 [Durotheca rogersii]|uniref:uncharacterized protein n=1 Tax=Durotheca rogersii TaxID=419775 RepID=UPI00221EB172|nr:uncharacterized protein GGS23DRAFT_614992 [Durotheca rogersii]KAI5866518.1 hypothetical protein GGS23DRAFT_614992 [Durotheca rogersii]
MSRPFDFSRLAAPVVYGPFTSESSVKIQRLMWECTPDSRYIEGADSTTSFYMRNGIPHEVLAPDGKTWIPFKAWMLHFCRRLRRAHVYPPQNPELFGGVYDRGYVSFWYVMKNRITIQKTLASMTRMCVCKQMNAFTADTIGPNQRFEEIIFTLFGLQYSDDDWFGLPGFITSRSVRQPWLEFRRDYLESHPFEPNPCWGTIQPILANPRLAAARRAAYGVGLPGEVYVSDKQHWSKEDHACRFIITLYNMAADRVGTEVDEWRPNAIFSSTVSLDFSDRHFFGYGLLNLLTQSWQFNQKHPSPLYEEYLTPVIYQGFKPHFFVFPHLDVGKLDLSSQTPWNTEKPPIHFNAEEARDAGLLTDDDVFDFEEDESMINIHP